MLCHFSKTISANVEVTSFSVTASPLLALHSMSTVNYKRNVSFVDLGEKSVFLAKEEKQKLWPKAHSC